MSVKKAPAPREARDTPISFRIKSSLKSALKFAADKDQRSVSQLIAIELENAMRAKGYLK